MTFMKQSRGLIIILRYAKVLSSQNIFIKSDDICLNTQGMSTACIFIKQNMFIKLQLLMSLSMNQFI